MGTGGSLTLCVCGSMCVCVCVCGGGGELLCAAFSCNNYTSMTTAMIAG